MIWESGIFFHAAYFCLLALLKLDPYVISNLWLLAAEPVQLDDYEYTSLLEIGSKQVVLATQLLGVTVVTKSIFTRAL